MNKLKFHDGCSIKLTVFHLSLPIKLLVRSVVLAFGNVSQTPSEVREHLCNQDALVAKREHLRLRHKLASHEDFRRSLDPCTPGDMRAVSQRWIWEFRWLHFHLLRRESMVCLRVSPSDSGSMVLLSHSRTILGLTKTILVNLVSRFSRQGDPSFSPSCRSRAGARRCCRCVDGVDVGPPGSVPLDSWD